MQAERAVPRPRLQRGRDLAAGVSGTARTLKLGRRDCAHVRLQGRARDPEQRVAPFVRELREPGAGGTERPLPGFLEFDDEQRSVFACQQTGCPGNTAPSAPSTSIFNQIARGTRADSRYSSRDTQVTLTTFPEKCLGRCSELEPMSWTADR